MTWRYAVEAWRAEYGDVMDIDPKVVGWPGLVYLMQNASNGLLKIGFTSRRVWTRLRHYHSHTGNDVFLEAVMVGDRRREGDLLCKCYPYRGPIGTEWFRDCGEVRECFSGWEVPGGHLLQRALVTFARRAALRRAVAAQSIDASMQNMIGGAS